MNIKKYFVRKKGPSKNKQLKENPSLIRMASKHLNTRNINKRRHYSKNI